MIKRIWVLTMFETYFDRFLDLGVLGRVFRDERSIDIRFEFESVPIAKFCQKGFKGVDDSPFGGGVGMIMRPDVLRQALIEGVINPGGYDLSKIKQQLHVVCPAPRGKTWNQAHARAFAQQYLSPKGKKDLVFICGRYEGIDERFLENYVDQFISLGDFILTGGELAVMAILDSALRFTPGVLGNKLSAQEESFADGKLEYALYTRPKEFEGNLVPDALSSGHHQKINDFKQRSSENMTKKYRPDLLSTHHKDLSSKDET